MPDERLTGTLIRLHDSGFGFIKVAGRGDFFVHIHDMRDRKDWVEKTEVSFTPGPPRPGKAPPAFDVAKV